MSYYCIDNEIITKHLNSIYMTKFRFQIQENISVKLSIYEIVMEIE